MIISNGSGIFVAVIGFVAALATELISETVTKNDRYYQQNPVMISVALAAAAVFTYGLHLILRRQKGQVVIDKATGEEIVLGKSHSLFFIPVKWWPATFLVIAAIVPFTVKP